MRALEALRHKFVQCKTLEQSWQFFVLSSLPNLRTTARLAKRLPTWVGNKHPDDIASMSALPLKADIARARREVR